MCANKLAQNDFKMFKLYMNQEDSALNNLQRLICHKTKPNQIKP